MRKNLSFIFSILYGKVEHAIILIFKVLEGLSTIRTSRDVRFSSDGNYTGTQNLSDWTGIYLLHTDVDQWNIEAPTTCKHILPMNGQERTNSQTVSEPQRLENNFDTSTRPGSVRVGGSLVSNAEISSASKATDSNTPVNSGISKSNIRQREDNLNEHAGSERPLKRARTIELEVGHFGDSVKSWQEANLPYLAWSF